MFRKDIASLSSISLLWKVYPASRPLEARPSFPPTERPTLAAVKWIIVAKTYFVIRHAVSKSNVPWNRHVLWTNVVRGALLSSR